MSSQNGGGDRSFLEQFKDVPVLLQLMLEEIQESRGSFLLGNMKILLLILGVSLYMMSPIDLIPEMIFGPIGLIDDVAVLGYGALSMAGIFFNILKERNNQAMRAR